MALKRKKHRKTPPVGDAAKPTGRPLRIMLVQVSSSHHYALWNALSVETLAGDIRGHFGEQVRVCIRRVRQASDISRVLLELEDFLPHMLGVSVEIGSLVWTNQLLDGLKSVPFPFGLRPLVVLGNRIAAGYPEYFLERYAEAIVVVGEGEISFRGIVGHFLRETDLKEVPNLVYLCEGQLARTVCQGPDLRLLVHPPAVDSVDEVLSHNGNAILECSRGCSWGRCAYCSTSSFHHHRPWQPFCIDRIRGNIEALVAVGVSELEFVDDDFIGGREPEQISRCRMIADLLEDVAGRHGRRISFRVFLTPHVVYKQGETAKNREVENLIARLKAVGLARVYLGVESGSPSQIHRYCRGHSLEEIEATLHLVRNVLHLSMDVGFIMFDPDMSLSELLENIEFYRKWNLIEGNQWPFRPVAVCPGTRLCANLRSGSRLGACNINLMQYEYAFLDPRIARINSILDDMSRGTRDIFYALKVISKQQFDVARKQEDTRRAQDYVVRNGLIYLVLMERLAKRLQAGSTNRCADLLAEGRRLVNGLVRECQCDVQAGRFAEHGHFLGAKIGEYTRGSNGCISP